MTPEREKYLREDAAWGTLPATKRLEVFAALDAAREETAELHDELAHRCDYILDLEAQVEKLRGPAATCKHREEQLVEQFQKAEGLEKTLRTILEDAVLSRDATNLVRDLIEKAKEQGITKDGRTVEVDHA